MRVAMLRCHVAAILACCACAQHDILLATLDGSAKLKWENKTDEVMGGSSTGSFLHLDKNSSTFSGECKAMPSPDKAAGWFSVEALLPSVPALNGCQGIAIKARTPSPYSGFRLSFGTDQWYTRQGYKAVFTVPAGDDFVSVNIPWEDFTRDWDEASGKPQIACTEDTSVCPTFVQLQNIQRLQLWAEGTVGVFKLEVEAISAYSCNDAPNQRTAWNITTACQQVCQPDPSFSKTEWCKHKDRGGCCVEVNPSWDHVPGYKHMEDFCDKLCMPDGPGKLAMCQPPAEYQTLTAVDPLDAIDKFYETNPDQCKNRIGNWAEAYCRSSDSFVV